MNNPYHSLLVVLLMGLGFNASTQGLDSVAIAFKTGDVTCLEERLDNNLELSIQNADATYSKDQAAMVLKDFFASHKPKRFCVMHQGSSPQGSKFLIGNLITAIGNYRTYLYAKAGNGTLKLEEIRIEEQ